MNWGQCSTRWLESGEHAAEHAGHGGDGNTADEPAHGAGAVPPPVFNVVQFFGQYVRIHLSLLVQGMSRALALSRDA